MKFKLIFSNAVRGVKLHRNNSVEISVWRRIFNIAMQAICTKCSKIHIWSVVCYFHQSKINFNQKWRHHFSMFATQCCIFVSWTISNRTQLNSWANNSKLAKQTKKHWILFCFLKLSRRNSQSRFCAHGFINFNK